MDGTDGWNKLWYDSEVMVLQCDTTECLKSNLRTEPISLWNHSLLMYRWNQLLWCCHSALIHPALFSWGWRQKGAGRRRTVEFDRNINSVTGHCSLLWCFKPVETFSAASMRRRSSSNASGRSSTVRRRSENLRFDEFGFAVLTKRKDVKLHHRCHEYRCDALSRWSTLAPRN